MPLAHRAQAGYVAPPPLAPGPRYWVASAPSNWYDDNAWSETSGGIPGAGAPDINNNVIFDANSTGACTCDGGIICNDFHVQSSHTGSIDLGDASLSHFAYGNCTFEGGGSFDFGNASLETRGNFINSNQSGWVSATGRLIMSGVDKTITSSTWNQRIWILEIASSLVTALAGVAIHQFIQINEDCKFKTEFSHNISGGGSIINGAVESSALLFLNGATSFGSKCNVDVATLRSSWSTWTFSAGATINPVAADNNGNPLTLTGDPVILGGNWTLSNASGSKFIDFLTDVTFSGPVTFSGTGGILDIRNNSGNPSLAFQGDVTITESGGTINWLKGTGSIALSGANAQSINFASKSVESLQIDKSADTATIAAGFTSDGLDGMQGSVDINGQTITLSGDLASSPGVSFLDTPNTGSIAVGGNFSLNGANGSEITWTGPDLNIIGQAFASWTIVTNSNASAGSAIDATDNCSDNGGNTGWTFT